MRETHEPSESIQAALVVAGGLNRFGDPNYRAVWGWNRLDWIGGKWEDRDEHGNLVREVVQMRREPKYPQVNRWHIERWLPPESYGSPYLWARQMVEFAGGQDVPALGPYPARGDYELCLTLEDAAGGFIQLTAAAARHIARAIEMGRFASKGQHKEAIEERLKREDRAFDAHADKVLSS